MTTHFDPSTLTRRADHSIHPTLALIEDHWNAQHIDGQVPRRADIAPDALGHALPFTFILHRAAPSIGRFRVAGQKLHDILRMDPRGMPLSAFFEGDDRSTLAEHIETAFSEPAVIALPLQAQAKLLRKKITRRCFCCRWPMKRAKSRGSWAGL